MYRDIFSADRLIEENRKISWLRRLGSPRSFERLLISKIDGFRLQIRISVRTIAGTAQRGPGHLSLDTHTPRRTTPDRALAYFIVFFCVFWSLPGCGKLCFGARRGISRPESDFTINMLREIVHPCTKHPTNTSLRLGNSVPKHGLFCITFARVCQC